MEKLTDAEIKKGLELCATLDENNCKKCPCREVCNEVDGELTKMVLDLINRKDAEIFNLKEEVKHFQLKNSELFKLNNSIVEENDYRKAEIERLKKSRDDLYEEMSERQKEEVKIARKMGKSEAYRECVERVKQVFGGNNIFETCVRFIVDSILNELTQNLHGTCTEGGNEDG